jgi:hypothetical protein
MQLRSATCALRCGVMTVCGLAPGFGPRPLKPERHQNGVSGDTGSTSVAPDYVHQRLTAPLRASFVVQGLVSKRALATSIDTVAVSQLRNSAGLPRVFSLDRTWSIPA